MNKPIKNFIISVFIAVISTSLFSATWTGAAGDNLWNNNANWENPAIFPNGVNDEAIFITNTNLVVEVNASVNVGSLNFATNGETGFLTINPLGVGMSFKINNEINMAPMDLGLGRITLSGIVSFASGATINFNNPNSDSQLSMLNLQVDEPGDLTINGTSNLGFTNRPSSLGGFPNAGTITINGGNTAFTMFNQTGVEVSLDAVVLNNMTSQLALGTQVIVVEPSIVGTDISGIGYVRTISDVKITNANSYSGRTEIAANTLTLDENGTLGDGTGPLTMIGTGALTLTAGIGAKSCGTLTGDAGNTINLNDNDLTVTQGVESTFAGIISGTGSFIKQGAETLNITGTSPGYTGEVNVNAGILSVNGDLSAGTLQINANGTLQGTGTVGTTTNGGNLAPGNSIGTIIIAGDYTQAANGTLTIEINGDGTSDKVTVTGDAFLDGTLSLDVLPGVYTKGTTYTILEATNVNGQFATLIDNNPLEFSAIYNADNVQVLIDEDVIILSIDKSGLTGNARHIADYYFCANSIPAVGSDFRSVLDLIVLLPASQLENAILQLGPQEFGALPLANLQNDVKMTNSFTSVLCRSAQICKKKNLNLNETPSEQNSLKECTCRSSGIWIKPILMLYDQNPSQNQWGFRNYTYGSALGIALNVGSRWMLNFGGGYTYSRLKWENNQGHANWDSIYLSPSVGYCTRSFYTTLALLSNINLYRVDRKIHFTGLNRDAENRHQGYDLLIRSEAGFRIPLARSAFFLEPEVQLNMINMFQRGYKETGANSLNLEVDRKLTIYLRPNAQMSVGAQFYSRKLSFLPKAYLGCLMDIPLTSGRYYAHAYGSERPSCQQEMCVISYYRTTTQMSYGTSFEIQSCKSFSFEMLYNSTVFSQFQVYDAKVKLNWRF